MANLQKNRMDFLAHTPAAGGQNHVPGSQALGCVLPTNPGSLAANSI